MNKQTQKNLMTLGHELWHDRVPWPSVAKVFAPLLSTADPFRGRRTPAEQLKASPRRALARIASAAKAGNLEAAFTVGECYFEGVGTAPHLLEAARWYLRAAEAGHIHAQYRLAQLHLFGLPGERVTATPTGLFESADLASADYPAAMIWARRAASAGAANAQALLGYILSAGPEALRDADAAAEWYRRSAEQDCPQGRLGYGYVLLAQADTNEQAGAAARDQLLRAAQAGLPAAHYLLGYAAELGVGTARNEAAARAHYQVAAAAGLCEAQARLAALLLEGRGGPTDGLNGESWLRRAALGGEHEAATKLGDLYASSSTLPPNYIEAARWYERAAHAGVAKAQVALAAFFLNGRGVARDHEQAASWLLRATEAGHAGAMFGLGALHGGGYDITPDYGTARRWLSAAAARHHPLATLALARYLKHGFGGAQDVEAAHRLYARAIQLRAPGAVGELACSLHDHVPNRSMPEMGSNPDSPQNTLIIRPQHRGPADGVS